MRAVLERAAPKIFGGKRCYVCICGRDAVLHPVRMLGDVDAKREMKNVQILLLEPLPERPV